MKLIAVLLNPTIDQIYKIDNFEVGGTFLVKDSIIYPVGKAISFSLGVRKLSKEVNLKVIAFIGRQETSQYSNFLNRLNIDFEFISIDGKTRSNKTINDPIKHTTTHIRERGFDITINNLQELTTLLKESVLKEDIVVFSGSIPPNAKKDNYYKLINLCKDRGATTVLDTNGEALIYGVKANPKIIKPNLVELSQILNRPELIEINLSNITDACKSIAKNARQLLNKELEIILITLGDKGAILLTNNLVLYGNVEIDKVIDTVGSGDSFLAGFVLNYLFKEDLLECFKYAIACGAANTLISGPGVFKLEDVKKISKEVEINQLC